MLGSVAEDSHILRCIYRSIDETNAERSSVAIGQGDHGQGSGRVDYLFNNDVHAITHRASDNSSVVDIIDRKTGMKKVINARLIVGADGPQSTVRRLGGISTWGWGYGQEAIVCTVQTPSSLAAHFSGGGNNVVTRSAFQKYLSGGPLAILPLWDGFSSIGSIAHIEHIHICTVYLAHFYRNEQCGRRSRRRRQDCWRSATTIFSTN